MFKEKIGRTHVHPIIKTQKKPNLHYFIYTQKNQPSYGLKYDDNQYKNQNEHDIKDKHHMISKKCQ